ncbi:MULTISPECIES: hypothetical protein [Gimesia]|mgnify:CR=1 FL=1|uniref:Uncharacterized protein n=1 Tax=Gimesia chilikensis TaxID=2605989 RepID=A0A517W5R2_9PLAN|nr:hypothetical protein [Gimesia chilikensis]MBN73882.1 hypothetical protein [Gimesia sp.]MCR9232787.1 hypothetical protein [bacterium]KAA0133333.1 hypothetical protein FYZ48_23470 [Gimesia chilikensis]QDT82648.1 hypothetical protein MalM14_02770 [Gimesia chilikensis]QDU00591.1 hypothetical protein V6x_02660 [Gimesia chilikensis]
MRRQLHLTTCCLLLSGLAWTGCQMGSDGPITSTLGFRDVPKQSEPPVETAEEIESRLAKEADQE